MPETTYLTTDTELTGVADAIRERGGTSESLEYPDGFVSAIRSIPAGGGDEAYNIRVGESKLVANQNIYKNQILFTNINNKLVPAYVGENTATNKSLNTANWVHTFPIYVYTGEDTITADQIVPEDNLYTKFSGFDLRYSTNCGTSLVAGKPVYIKISYNNQSSAYACLENANDALVQSFPQTYSVKYYMRLGTAISDHEIDFEEDHPIFRAYGTSYSFVTGEIPPLTQNSGYFLRNSGGYLSWAIPPGITTPSSSSYDQIVEVYSNSTSPNWVPSSCLATRFSSFDFWPYGELGNFTKTDLGNSTWKYEKVVCSDFLDTIGYDSYSDYSAGDFVFTIDYVYLYADENEYNAQYYNIAPDDVPDIGLVFPNGVANKISVYDSNDTLAFKPDLTVELIKNQSSWDLKLTFVCNRNFSSFTIWAYMGTISILTNFAKKIAGGSSITVDNALDSTSTNPVENRAIYAVIGNIESLLQAI